MPQIIFADPLGGPFRNISCEEVVDLLTNRGQEYWNRKQGSGSAQLYYCEDESAKDVSTEIALNITANDKFGVYVCHYGSDGRSHSASVGEMDIKKIVHIFDAHEGFRLFPQCLFVPLADALEAVSHFCKTGGCSPKIQWLRSGLIPWAELESETERIRNTEGSRHREK